MPSSKNDKYFRTNLQFNLQTPKIHEFYDVKPKNLQNELVIENVKGTKKMEKYFRNKFSLNKIADRKNLKNLYPQKILSKTIQGQFITKININQINEE